MKNFSFENRFLSPNCDFCNQHGFSKTTLFLRFCGRMCVHIVNLSCPQDINFLLSFFFIFCNKG